MSKSFFFWASAIAGVALSISSIAEAGITIEAPFASDYTFNDLGAPAGVPLNLATLVVKAGDSNTLLVGGASDQGAGAVYSVAVTRDANQHITGFNGVATLFSTAPNIDGGLGYGPGGVLFYTGYSNNILGEIKPGSLSPDKTINLSTVGISSSVGSLAFVPNGFPGAGDFKIDSYNGGSFYDVKLTPDGNGTYDIASATATTAPNGGPEGIAYVPLGSTDFPNPSLLIGQYSLGKVSAYELDANGNPIVATQRDFITGLTGVQGAAIDPVTGDFLFLTFGGGNKIVVVEGFSAPAAVPEPGSLVLWSLGALGSALTARRRKQS